ncbi:hypothetical protein Pan216_02090 [Planctomycetes bacterium Pan216]|uniref:Uncharacterized protein n=1 Tax=Kolteria novifilia TaxID=2527975 RepID=A0A518AXD1_9BACT|nr:hypothetical protein Pan216_02090 [Planctomycetes bacterium Pan216]
MLSNELEVVRRYFLPGRDSFWEWRDGGDVVAWRDGRTIAFRLELEYVVRKLSDRGLPPLNALLLLLAATRDNWEDGPQVAGLVSSHVGESGSGDLLVEVLDGLHRIRSMPAEEWKPLREKAYLASMIFEESKSKTSPNDGKLLADALRDHLREMIDVPDDEAVAVASPGAFERHLEILREGLRRFDEEALELRRTTGLDRLPRKAELELPVAERIRALLGELEQEASLRGVARLARRMMATATLPRAIAEDDEMPLGGVSDIANRGELDRLLLSELAHDDLTLAVRVAENEALYLRRETPPRTPERARVLLLDVGMRMWGLPRLFSASAALAFAASNDPTHSFQTFHARGGKLRIADLTTRDGLVAHLSTLDTDCHPGAVLRRFHAVLAKNEAEDKPVDPLILTTDAVLEDRAFQRALEECRFDVIHLASVSRDGWFRLHERTRRGRKLLREAWLDLEGLFENGAEQSRALVDFAWANNLPAIFSVEPFPLLLPKPVTRNRVWSIPDQGVFSIPRDRRLLFWSRPDRGARQFALHVPPGEVQWTSHDEYGRVTHALVGPLSKGNVHCLRIDLERSTCDIVPLQLREERYGHVAGHQGMIFAVHEQEVDVFHAHSGELFTRWSVPSGLFHAHGRFFQDSLSRWHALGFDGFDVQIDLVFDQELPQPLVYLFDRQGVEGPLAITQQGHLFTADRGMREVDHGLTSPMVRSVASDGSRFLLVGTNRDPKRGRTGQNASVYRLVDVDSLGVVTIPSHEASFAVEKPQRFAFPRSLRSNFTDAAIDGHGRINLFSKKGARLVVGYDSAIEQICLNVVGSKDVNFVAAAQPLRPIDTPGEVGFRLSMATFDDGSKLFLDARGLLHLYSADRELVPEATLVLNEGMVSGWCADGRVWGERYFIGDVDQTPPRDVYDSVVRAFCERIA